MTTQNLTTCRCNHCNGEIEFEKSRDGETITCPICAMDTNLYVPHVAQRIPSSPPPSPPAASHFTAPSGEKIFFQTQGISISDRRIVMPGQTIPMSAVSTVRADQKAPGKLWPTVALAIAFFGVLGMVGMGSISTASVVFYGALIAFGIWGYMRPIIYSAVVSTAGGDQSAYSSTDRRHVEQVLAAMNEAIVAKN